jgi:peroxiredoxin
MRLKIIVGLAIAAIAIGGALAWLRPTAAPEVRFATLSGESFATSDLRGKVVLVNFWATSCVTCIEEMPEMIETYRRFAPRGYEMVAVAMSYDHPNRVAQFVQERALPFKVALDGDGEIARRFGDVRATPMTFLLDRRGRLLKQYLGTPDWGELRGLLGKALSDPA